jgi:hypothetical protein
MAHAKTKAAKAQIFSNRELREIHEQIKQKEFDPGHAHFKCVGNATRNENPKNSKKYVFIGKLMDLASLIGNETE